MKTSKKVLALSLVMVLSLLLFAVSANRLPQAYTVKAEPLLKSKAVFLPPGERLPVWVILKEQDPELLSETLLRTTGLEADLYENSARSGELRAQIEAEVAAETGGAAANQFVLYDETLKQSADTLIPVENGRFCKAAGSEEIIGRSLVEQRLTEARDTYLAAKRKVYRDAYLGANRSFANERFHAQNKVVYRGEYTSTTVVECTRQEMEELARDSRVEKLAYFEDVVPIGCSDITIEQQIRAGYGGGNKSAGFKGQGVIVGVFENMYLSPGQVSPVGGRYSQSIQLRNIGVDRYFFKDKRTADSIATSGATVSTGDHATKVCSILAGRWYERSGRTFEGIVPLVSKMVQYPIGASAYDALASANDFVSVEHGHVINWSGGLDTGNTGYTVYDQEIDQFIRNTGVTFVCAAGNNDNDQPVVSPARAYNTIAVGNADTKNGHTIEQPPYMIYSASRGFDAAGMPNKPDIAAPGVDIQTIYSDDTIGTGSAGTSWATPHVTGVVCQLMQKNADYRQNPEMIKAVLLNGADAGKISSTNNALIASGTPMRNLSGAGFLDGKNAVDFFSGTYIRSYYFESRGLPSSYYDMEAGSIPISAGYKIRVTLSYLNLQNTGLKISLLLLSPSGALVGYSGVGNNNVQQIEYTVPSSGTYRVVLRLHNTMNPDTLYDHWAALAFRYWH